MCSGTNIIDISLFSIKELKVIRLKWVKCLLNKMEFIFYRAFLSINYKILNYSVPHCGYALTEQSLKDRKPLISSALWEAASVPK